MSGRGGASGVGIHLFFVGGIVWDGGHPSSPEFLLRPSSASIPTGGPPLLARWQFPSQWKIGLILPAGNSISGPAEEQFFRTHAPIPRAEALETMAAMYHSIIPAFAMNDLDLLRQGLTRLHEVGFKKFELEAQPDDTKQLLKAAQMMGASGMSSMGPLLYTIYDMSNRHIEQALKNACKELGATFLGAFEGWNLGREASVQ